MRKIDAYILATAMTLAATHAFAADVRLLNASYSPTQNLYNAIDPLFAAEWKRKTGDNLTIDVSYKGSGSQSRAVIAGLDADVATLALGYDIDAIAQKAHLLTANWQSRLPDNSAPYTSTIVFLVRKGNPWHIKDWLDIIKSGLQVIAPNPKTSGGARWEFLAAWAYALHAPGGNEQKAKNFVGAVYKHVPVLDRSARDSTITFTEHGIGDVLLAWENEAKLAVKEHPDDYDIVYPSASVLAEPPVAVLDTNVKSHGTAAIAEAYLKFLYTPVAQEVEAKNFYRPRDKVILAKYAKQFPALRLYTIGAEFGGWDKAQAKFFADGGVFDQIYSAGR